MNTQKGFAPILIILLGLVVIGGGTYFYKENNKLFNKNNADDVIKDKTKEEVGIETLAKNSASSTGVLLTNKDDAIQSQKKSVPLTMYFEKTPNSKNISNVVGYFSGGAFYTSLPVWMPDNWRVDASDDGEITVISPFPNIDNRDFSDIRMITLNSSESFNANWLFENEKKSFFKNIINSEVITTDNGNMLVYHIEKDIGEQITDLYYIDGDEKTAIISFSSSKINYYYYGAKIKEFIQNLSSSKKLQG
jgi:hypothetical protein